MSEVQCVPGKCSGAMKMSLAVIPRRSMDIHQNPRYVKKLNLSKGKGHTALKLIMYVTLDVCKRFNRMKFEYFV